MKIIINVSDEVINKFCKDNEVDVDNIKNDIIEYFKYLENNDNFKDELINKILNY